MPFKSISATAPYVVLRAHRDVLPHVGVKTLEDMVIISTDRRYRMPERAVVVIDIYAPFISKFMLNGGKCIRLGDIRLKSPLTLEIDGVGAITANVLKAPEVKSLVCTTCRTMPRVSAGASAISLTTCLIFL